MRGSSPRMTSGSNRPSAAAAPRKSSPKDPRFMVARRSGQLRGQPRRLSRWTNLANGDHEEYSFVSGRDADKTPPPPTILKRRLNMKAILLVAGIAALLASPAMAQQGRPHNTPQPNIPKDARASVAAPSGANEGGPYTPSIATPPHGTNRDFQNGSTN